MVSDHSRLLRCVNLVVPQFVKFQGVWFFGKTFKSSVFLLNVWRSIRTYVLNAGHAGGGELGAVILRLTEAL